MTEEHLPVCSSKTRTLNDSYVGFSLPSPVVFLQIAHKVIIGRL